MTIFEGSAALNIINDQGAGAATEQFISSLAKRKLNRAQLNIVKVFTEDAINFVESQLELVMAKRLLPAGWHLDVKWCEADSFSASAGPGVLPNMYQIRLALLAPITLLSLSHELDKASRRWLVRIIKQLSQRYFQSRFAINDWLRNVHNESDVSLEATEQAMDAVLLLYFHELAHVLFGHTSIQISNDNERRAIEADADFNAGSMLSLYLLGQKQDIPNVEKRLVHASLLLGTVLKAISGKSGKYHYPSIRTIMYVAGGESAVNAVLKSSPGKKNYVNWSHSLPKYMSKFLSALRATSMACFGGTEQGITKDVSEFENITFPLRDQLKDGILQKTRVPV